MRALAAIALVALVAGCPAAKRGQGTSARDLIRRAEDAFEVPATIVVRPGSWEEAGVELRVPTGWIGEQGPPGTDHRLALMDAVSGAMVDLYVADGSTANAPRPRSDCRWGFVDTGAHREVPSLSEVRSATCVPSDPLGPLVVSWHGRAGERQLWLEVSLPAGKGPEARRAAMRVVDSLEVR